MSEVGVAHWLSLAAAPTFAALALLNGAFAAGQPSPLCAAAPGAWPVGDMGLMYLLMSVFHTAPWLRLLAARRNARDASPVARTGG